MRIAIDIRDLQIAKTGAKTYLEEITNALPRLAPQHQFIFLEPKNYSQPNNNPLGKIISHLNFWIWKEIELPWLAWQSRCDLIFCTDYVVPLVAHCPSISVFYDASFWANPEHYNHLWRLLMKHIALPAARKSPAIITISRFSKDQINYYTNIAPQKIFPISIAPKTSVRTQLEKSVVHKILQQYNVSEPFVLYVGVLEKRKNLPRLIEAFARFIKYNPDYQLVLVGQPGPKQNLDDSVLIRRTIEKLCLQKSVVLVGYVSDQDLSAFYQGADFFVFPSLREGFGIPILEAFNNNLPVLTSNVSAIPEVGGDAVLYVDPFDVEDIAEGMINLANDKILQTELIEQGKKQAALFSWDKTALQLVEIFEKIKNSV